MTLVRGQLAAVDVSGNSTLTDVYTVPAGKVASVNINIANRADTATDLRIAVIKSGVATDVANEDYILFDLSTDILVSNLAPIEKNGVLMAADDTIAVYSSTSAVSAQVNGIEEDV